MGIFDTLFKKTRNEGGVGRVLTEAQIEFVATMTDRQILAHVERYPEQYADIMSAKKILQYRAKAKPYTQITAGPKCVIGEATGEFLKRNATASMGDGESIVMGQYDLFEGLVVVGKPGSGKTRAVLQPLARDWLADPSTGMMANGIKWSWAKTLGDIARYCGRSEEQIHRIGVDGQKWSILRGLSPDGAGQFVRTSFDLTAKGASPGGGAQFFQDSASNIVTAIAMILCNACSDGPVEVEFPVSNGTDTKIELYRYSLDSIYDACFLAKADKQWHIFDERMRLRARQLHEQDRSGESVFILDGLDAIHRELASMDAVETKDGIMGQIATALSLFRSNRKIREAFCGDDEFDLSCLDRGDVIILDVDLEQFPRAGELVYLLAFQHLSQHAMRRDRDHVTNPVMLMMDEFTSCASNTMVKTFQTARSANIAVVIAFQSLAKLNDVLGGKTQASAMVGTLRNLICYTADEEALQILNSQIGKAEIKITDKTTSKGWQSASLTASMGGMQTGSTTATRTEFREVVDPGLFRGLRNTMRRGVPISEQIGDAVCSLTIAKQNKDGVVVTHPWDPDEG